MLATRYDWLVARSGALNEETNTGEAMDEALPCCPVDFANTPSSLKISLERAPFPRWKTESMSTAASGTLHPTRSRPSSSRSSSPSPAPSTSTSPPTTSPGA
ncbi:hypothetical protein V492_05118 [Pseudogymnoascus sp. VKM F-4246]|nr:hypothetical protein V492_05118 [Pseudogymnoascus sp. VKM F-4246]